MEHGKFIYNRWRWPQLVLMFGVGCFGLILLYFAIFTDGAKNGAWFVGVLGGIFAVFGLAGSIGSYFSSCAYERISKMFFNEMDDHKNYDNGLLIVVEDGRFATFIRNDHNKIYERGYVKVKAIYNRKRKLINWWFLHF